LSEAHPNRARAIGVLETLRKKEVPIRFGTAKLNTIHSLDTFPLILKEVIDHEASNIRFRDVVTFKEEENTKPVQQTLFLTSFKEFQSDVGYAFSRDKSLYAVWDLQLNPNGDLAHKISIPDEYKRGSIFKLLENGKPDIRATITPAGTISEPHIDQSGSGTLLIELQGIKMFVIWPPSKKNLANFEPFDGSQKTGDLEALLEVLEKAECLILEQGECHLLGPGYIHGVLSPMNSAVAGVRVVRESLRTGAREVMEWESAFIRKLKYGTTEEQQIAKGIEDQQQEDRALWLQLHEIVVSGIPINETNK